jgi:hypothetical protein
MRRTARLVVAAAAVGSVALVASPASAQSACSAYSGTCDAGTTSVLDRAVPDTDESSAVLDRSATRGASTGVTSRPTSLPFTGDETALLALGALGTVAAGAGLVVAGRRRTAAA